MHLSSICTGAEDLSSEDLRKLKDKENMERKQCFKARIDLARTSSTDLPGSKDIVMPGPVEMGEEVNIQIRSQLCMDTLHE